MKNWLRLLYRILNPRADLSGLPSLSGQMAVATELAESEAPAHSQGGLSLRHILTNPPLMIGTIIVLGLFALVLFGPVWAPQNPYIAGQHIVPHLDRETGEFIRPPLPPSPTYPLGTDQWGADILSLLMHGTRNTLIACAFITMVRVLLGLILGAIAGWNEGQTSDRIIMGLIGTITSLPLLISTMILIYALDIRQGLLVFIIALSIIGWSEIAQYIRSEFLVLRQMPFIEGAQATGLTNLQIAVRHILPNILPHLLVISFLEMGAVLILLGELGFVGVFIGGGSRIDLSEPLGPQIIVTLVDVPEWGAMIADGHRWLRSKPFVVFPPALAFFVAVMGFNSLGEGLRRLLDKHNLNTAFLLRKRMLVVIAILSFATIFILNNTGAAPWFAKVAQAFDGERVYEHVTALAAMDGRGADQPGGIEAAAYIAERFEAYGLTPGWKRQSYVYPLETQLVGLTAQPGLSLWDDQGNLVRQFRHQIDFGFSIDGHGGSGEARAPVTFVGFDQAGIALSWESYKELDFRDQIVMLLQDNAPAGFATEALIRGANGVLWISGNGRDAVRSQVQLADPAQDYLLHPQLPIFRIRPYVAQAILGVDDLDLASLVARDSGLEQAGPGWFTVRLSGSVGMSVALSSPKTREIPNIIGYMPGTDFDLGREIVVNFVSYDGLGNDPDGTVFPAANHNASGVALLLELARLWQEQGLDARRTTMFIAWGGGQLDYSGAQEFLENEFNFRHLLIPGVTGNVGPAIIFQYDYIGDGEDVLLIHPDSDRALIQLIEETGADSGISVEPGADTEEFGQDLVSRNIPAWISMKWAGPGRAPDRDRLEYISQEKLQRLGEMLALALTKVVRETEY
jgi:peptide/nickel transport system permease protein